jgi:choice-of-anchor B domain-containing protein
MKSATAISAIAALVGSALSKEMPVDAERAAELYDSGVRHEQIMMLKEQVWEEMRIQGVFESSQYTSFDTNTASVACKNGVASYVPGDAKYTFKCKNLDLYDFKTHAELGSAYGRGAGSWGWTSPRGREFVAIAQEDGTAFAEVTSKGKLVYLGRLPQYTTAEPSLWREIKGYKSYVVIGSEAYDHGVQIFDLRKLQKVDPASPKLFTNEEDLDGWWNDELPWGRSHNVVTNEERHYAAATGFQPRNGTLGAGLVFIDLTDPSSPKTLGGSGEDGYVHDAQCLVYRGPDSRYVGRDICYGYNEDSLTIYDVEDKQNIKIISRTSYQGVAYTHQGWVLDRNWQHYLILDDEYDEVNITKTGAYAYPVSYIWDVSDLTAPKQTGKYTGARRGIDHNQFVIDGFSHQSNYGLGYTVLDLRSVPKDPTGKGIKEVAYFDIHPEDDNLPGGGNETFTGTWSHYPYFKSGYVVINTMDRGAFVVKRSSKAAW